MFEKLEVILVLYTDILKHPKCSAKKKKTSTNKNLSALQNEYKFTT